MEKIIFMRAAICLGAVLTLCTSGWAQSTQPDPQRDARMAWWRDARFGMFIHWGVYSVPAGMYEGKQVPRLGEWIMNTAKIPVATYAKYAEEFNPTKFDAREWVSIAKAAGMKYIVITAKHHDGFAMFGSKVDGYNIVNATPFKRDPLKELAAECQKQGMKLGFYYSQAQDWHHPGGASIRNGHWDPAAQDGNFPKYFHEVAIPQVRELLGNYGPISVIWWDTPGPEITPALAAEMEDVLKLQPQIIQNNRLGGKVAGDTETPEQRIPPAGFPGRDWETCMTINDTWGFKSFDTNFKSNEKLLQNLIDIASKGGNYLLNVGPTAEGIIPAPEVERLRFLGEWLKVNGEAIYGTGPTPFGAEAGSNSTTRRDAQSRPVFVAKWEWRCTRRPGKLYIHVFKWPGEKMELPHIAGKISRAYLLADPRHDIDVSQSDEKTTLTLPEKAPDPIASVIALEVQGQR